MITFASVKLAKTSAFKHSRRNAPLKRSLLPFCQVFALLDVGQRDVVFIQFSAKGVSPASGAMRMVNHEGMAGAVNPNATGQTNPQPVGQNPAAEDF